MACAGGQMGGEASVHGSEFLWLSFPALMKAFSLFVVNYFLSEMRELHYNVISTACCSLREPLSPWVKNLDILPIQPCNSK